MKLLALIPCWAAVKAAGECGSHPSQSECISFRHQHQCSWDVASQACVPDVPCEKRSQETCRHELTTGAEWDETENKCFWDGRVSQCRWADECMGHETWQQCLSAYCEWRQHCTPEDMSFQPGPNVCFEACSVPSPGAPAAAPAKVRAAANASAKAASAVVDTTTGQVQGNQLASVKEFLGIPFAQPPVGALRWAPPKPMDRWNAVFQATSFGAACTQSLDYVAGSKKCQGYTRDVCFGYNEDCLTLNVWTPSTSGKRAVLFWIHGGCYVSGSASDAEYNATQLAASQDVVVVTVQYRLGVFGFLGNALMRPRDPKGSTGNYGLMDNIAALQWVKENIANFGGDPDRVTIFGESSGAGSVSLLMGVKEAWPYFHRGITESGTGSFWTYITMDAANSNWEKILSATKCHRGSNVLACILRASRALLTGAVTSVPCRDGCSWAPVLDGAFLPGTPYELAKAGQLRPNTPTIAGFNLNDGAMFVPSYPFGMAVMNQARLAGYFSKRFGEEKVSQLQQLFKPSKNPQAPWLSEYFNAAQKCETDFSYSCTAQWISSYNKAPAFVYKFSQTDEEGLVLHGDEIPYIFGTLSNPSSQQKQVGQWMMQFWANFAKRGDPNGPGLPQWPEWKGAGLLNISHTPEVAEVHSWPGCDFFLSNWDYYSLCLPAEQEVVV